MSKYRKKPVVIEDDSVALSHDELILSFCRTLIDNINNPNFDFDKKTKMIMNIHSYILSSLDYEKELEKENEKLSIENDELLDNKLELVVKNKQQDIFIEKLIQENEMLKITILEYKSQQELFWDTATNNANLRKENQKLKNAIEIAKNIIDWKHKIYYWYEHNFITKAEYDLLKEVLKDE